VCVCVCACVRVCVRASVLGICIWNTPNVEHIEIKATRRFFELLNPVLIFETRQSMYV